MSSAQNTPIIMVSMTRKAIMYSLTRSVIACQLASTQIGVRNADNTTNNIEMPSTPTEYLMPRPGIHSMVWTNWKSGLDGSNHAHKANDRMKVASEVHSATARAFRATISASPRMVRIIAAPTSGRKMIRLRIGSVSIPLSPPRQPCTR